MDSEIQIRSDSYDASLNDEADFSFDGFQVVRSEYLAHMNEPAIAFTNCKVTFNTASIKKLPEMEYVQFLVNPESKKLAVRKCEEDDKDSFLWCNTKRKPRHITCRIFFAMLANLMNWDPRHKYKILGHIIRTDTDTVILFDLCNAGVYEYIAKEGEKPRKSRTPVFPDEWKNSFGIPYAQHQCLKQINIIDGYTLFSIDNGSTKATTAPDTFQSEVQHAYEQ